MYFCFLNWMLNIHQLIHQTFNIIIDVIYTRQKVKTYRFTISLYNLGNKTGASDKGYCEFGYCDIYWPKVLTDQSGWSRFFRKLEILRKLKRTNLKQAIIHLSKLLKFIKKKSLCHFFGQRLEGTIPKYAPSVLSSLITKCIGLS